MPHGESWITILFRGLLEDTSEALANLGLDWSLGFGGVHRGVHLDTSHVFGWILAVLVVFALGVVATSSLRDQQDRGVVPDDQFSIRTIMELLVSTSYKMMSDMMGPKAARFFLPLVGTCALLILASNAMGLVPGFVPPTHTLNTTLACALVILVVTHSYGIKEHGLAYFKHFAGPIRTFVALPLVILMIGLETLTHFAIRPGTLAIRLAANMTADHAVLDKFLNFGAASIFVFPTAMYLLGAVVVIVQTLVFCLLATVYISQATAHEEH